MVGLWPNTTLWLDCGTILLDGWIVEQYYSMVKLLHNTTQWLDCDTRLLDGWIVIKYYSMVGLWNNTTRWLDGYFDVLDGQLIRLCPNSIYLHIRVQETASLTHTQERFSDILELDCFT